MGTTKSVESLQEHQKSQSWPLGILDDFCWLWFSLRQQDLVREFECWGLMFLYSRLQGYTHGIVTSGINSLPWLADELLLGWSLKHIDSLNNYVWCDSWVYICTFLNLIESYMYIKTSDTVVTNLWGSGLGLSWIQEWAHKPQASLANDVFVVNEIGHVGAYVARS